MENMTLPLHTNTMTKHVENTCDTANIDNGVSQGHHQLHPVSLHLTATSFCGSEGVEGEHGKDEDTRMGEKCSRRLGK